MSAWNVAQLPTTGSSHWSCTVKGDVLRGFHGICRRASVLRSLFSRGDSSAGVALWILGIFLGRLFYRHLLATASVLLGYYPNNSDLVELVYIVFQSLKPKLFKGFFNVFFMKVKIYLFNWVSFISQTKLICFIINIWPIRFLWSVIFCITRFLYKKALFGVFSYYFTAWKVFQYGVFSSPYFPAFGLNTVSPHCQMRKNTDHKKLRIWTLFTQYFISAGKDLTILNNIYCGGAT